MDLLHGIVIRKRSLSKKLVFLDLERSSGSALELCLRPNDSLPDSAVHDLRDAIKLGDEVEAAGHFEDSATAVFQVHSISTVRSWKDTHPQQPFVHRPVTSEVPLPPSLREKDAGQQAVRGQLCKFHLHGGAGSCTRGAACPFLHADLAAVPRLRQRWITDRRQHRQQLAADAGDPHAGDAQRKSQRAAIFAQWLLGTYGSAYLNQGTGVLDIAGGRGALSFRLQTLHGVRCTCIDPRPPALSKPARRHLRELRKGRPGGGLALLDACDAIGEAALCRDDGSVQQQVLEGGEGLPWALLEGRGASEVGPASAEEPQQGVEEPGGEVGAPPGHILAEFTAELWRGEHGAQLRQASLVVGLHPDQATDAIVEFAVQHGKPFAVVPCCVFPRLFKHRQLLREGPAGEVQTAPVEAIDDLVEWLAQRGGPATEVQHLTFEGMNRVVFQRYLPALSSSHAVNVRML